MVKFLVERGAHCSAEPFDLIGSVVDAGPEMLRFVIDHGFDVAKRRSEEGDSAIRYLINYASGGCNYEPDGLENFSEMIDILRNQGLALNERDPGGHTLLHEMLDYDIPMPIECIQIVIDEWPEPEIDVSHLIEAMTGRRRHSEEMRLLLDSGKVDVNGADENGYSPLHLAAIFCIPEAIEILLFYGADLEVRRAVNNFTPLLSGSAFSGGSSIPNRIRTIDLLIQHGADIHARVGIERPMPLIDFVLTNQTGDIPPEVIDYYKRLA